MLNNLKKNNYIRNFSILFSGTIVGQVLTFLSTPFVTRLYSAEIIGMYTLILSFTGVFQDILSARYNMAIIAAKNEDDANNLIGLSLILCIITTFIFGSGIGLYFFFEFENYGIVLQILIYLILLTSGISVIYNAASNRLEGYSNISKSSVFRRGSQSGIQVFSGIFNTGTNSLLFSNVLSTILSLVPMKSDINLKKLKYVKYKKMKKLLLENYKQAVFDVPNIMLVAFSRLILNTGLSSLFGIAIFGIYSMSEKLLGIVISLLATNLSQLFYVKAIKDKKNTGSFYRVLLKMIVIMFIISIIVFVIINLFSRPIIEIFLGEEWGSVYFMIVAMSPLYIVQLVSGSVKTGFILLERQGIDLIFQIVTVSVIFIFYIIGSTFENINQFLFIYSLFQATIHVLYLLVMLYFAKKEEGKK